MNTKTASRSEAMRESIVCGGFRKVYWTLPLCDGLAKEERRNEHLFSAGDWKHKEFVCIQSVKTGRRGGGEAAAATRCGFS